MASASRRHSSSASASRRRYSSTRSIAASSPLSSPFLLSFQPVEHAVHPPPLPFRAATFAIGGRTVRRTSPLATITRKTYV